MGQNKKFFGDNLRNKDWPEIEIENMNVL